MINSCLYLIGAGPGDPELITLKAIRILESAKVILYDALVNEAVLKHAPPDCIKKFVGKRYGQPSLSQDEINSLIIQYAVTHGQVVRLKGGDPFVFGRAQEEIEAAEKANIPVEIVPGISSAISVPASQMIPLTCRGLSESFWVTTGTTQSGDFSSDLKLAAQSSATVIILMAMNNLEAIMEIFIRHGKGETSAAIIQNGTREHEKMVIGKVKDIFFKAEREKIRNPAVAIVGEVVNLNDSLRKNDVNERINKFIEVGLTPKRTS